MDELLKKIRRDYPDLQFIVGQVYRWSPHNKSITYIKDVEPAAFWSLLHELGHALLGHQAYSNDVELLQKEVLAWEKAKELGKRYGVRISDEHIQDCLDSYRDWLDKRSACPSCGIKTTACDAGSYRCFNCHATWTVGTSRYRRPYRRSLKTAP